MMDKQWARVDRYLAANVLPSDPALDAALDANARAGLPSIDVSPLQGQLLYLLARMMGARRILEVGTLGGYSTICLARAVGEGGRVVTLEAEPHHADVARGNIARAGLSGVVDLRLGFALDILPTLAGEAPFDLIFLDADKPSMPDYLTWSLRLSRARHGDHRRQCRSRRGSGRRTQHRSERARGPAIPENDRRESALGRNGIADVGSKGWDGLAIALVEAGDNLA